MRKIRITGKRESETGRNIKFQYDGRRIVGLTEVKKDIKSGKLPDYQWVKPKDGRKPFPRAKPNKTERDNIDEQKDI